MTIERMSKVRVVCGRNSTASVVRALYDFGSIEVREQKVFPQSNKPLPEFRDISGALIELRSAEKTLESVSEPKERRKKEKPASATTPAEDLRNADSARLLSEFRGLPLRELSELKKRKDELGKEAEALAQKRAELAPFKNLRVKTTLISAARLNSRLRFAYFQLRGATKNAKAAEKTESECECSLLKLPAKLVFSSSEGRNYALAAFPSSAAQAVREAMTALAAKEIAIPDVQTEHYGEALAQVEAKAKQNAEALRGIAVELAEFKKKFLPRIALMRGALELKAGEASLPAKFGETSVAVSVEAWLPNRLKPALAAELERKLGKKFVLEEIPKSEAGVSPVLLKNRSFIKPFEFFIRFFSLPGSHDIDPTFLVSLTFPIFFGMILGDIGYGLLALLLALALRFKAPKGFFRTAGGIMLLSALFTIAFGFVYGEFFGFENVLGYPLHPIIARGESEGLQVLIALTVLVGAIHLGLGYAVGVAENAVERHWKHAAAKASWLLLEISMLAFLTASAQVVFFAFLKPLAEALPTAFSLPFVIASLVGIIVFEGPMALFEIFGLFSNLFSYLRIMALGVSGVILALIINKLPLSFNAADPVSIVSFVLFAAIFVLGHLGSLALGLFEASIQSLRLHYVEFFSKFYRGGGIPFLPLREN